MEQEDNMRLSKTELYSGNNPCEEFRHRAKIIYNQVRKLDPTIKKLPKLIIPLDRDPITKGLGSLNLKISDIQKSKDYLCEISLLVINLKNQAENIHTEYEKFISERKSRIMKGDEIYYRDLKTQAMRELALEEHMREEIILLSKLTQLVNILKNYRESTQIYLGDLESINNNLKKQLSVIEMMISIGEIELKSPSM